VKSDLVAAAEAVATVVETVVAAAAAVTVVVAVETAAAKVAADSVVVAAVDIAPTQAVTITNRT
jgi:hypothetical protein